MTRVLVTRSSAEADRLVRALEHAGLDVRLCPLVSTEPVDGPSCDAGAYDWVVFTSRAGVRFGLARLSGAPRRVAAIGPGTAEALREAGVDVTLVASEHSQRGLVAALGPRPGAVLFPGAEQASTELVDALGAHHLIVYRTVELGPAHVPDADLAVLASPSAARALARRRLDIPCVTIGSSTTREAVGRGLDVIAEATSSDLDGLVQAARVAASSLQ